MTEQKTKAEQIGANLAALRGNLSQAKLSHAMRRNGFKWTHSTVFNVEAGVRALRLEEACAILDILARPMDDLRLFAPEGNTRLELARASLYVARLDELQLKKKIANLEIEIGNLVESED